MNRAPRDQGLVREIGTFGLAASIINGVIGAGIFVVPAAMSAGAGASAPLAFLCCAILMAGVVICFAEGGRRIATSGGPYGYIDAAFGPFAGFLAGTLLWVGDVLACGGVVAALADAISTELPQRLATVARPILIITALSSVAAINASGVAWGTRFVGAATLIKLLPLLVFIAVGMFSLHSAHLSVTSAPSAHGFGRAVILGVYAFTGMEIALAASGEVRQPSRTIPRALAIAMLFVTLLYVAIQFIAQGMLGAALASSSAPLADAMGRVNPALRTLLLVGTGFSMFAWLGSDLLGSPRILFAFGRDGLLPARLGRVHPRTHAPHIAIFAYGAIAAVLALTGTFAELAVLATLTTSTLYLAGCAAVWALSRREGPAGAAVWLTAAPVAGIVGMLFVIGLASSVEIGGLLAMIAISALAYWLRYMAYVRRSEVRS
ncbi:MAG TPA: amino acid permease [Steroidobacteraceae bacterium]